MQIVMTLLPVVSLGAGVGALAIACSIRKDAKRKWMECGASIGALAAIEALRAIPPNLDGPREQKAVAEAAECINKVIEDKITAVLKGGVEK